MKTSCLAFVTVSVFFGIAGLIVACGGSESMDVLGAPTQATTTSSGGGTSGGGTSGGTSGGGTSGGGSGTSGGTSGGCLPVVCDPPPGCSITDACSCAYACPDAGGAVKCEWNANADACPAGSYCDAPSCGEGVCVKKGTNENPASSPQCGCNGVTYWNNSVARTAGMAVRHAGACRPDEAKTCGGFAPGPSACPDGSTCNRDVKKKNGCLIADTQGTCWMPLEKCPAVVVAGRAHPCGSETCTDACTAIKKGIAWYEDNTCPQ